MMKIHFAAAAVLLLSLGAAHSWLGERLILIPLLRRTDLPKVFGSGGLTKRTLRFAWHITTITLWCLAALLLVLSRVPIDGTLRTISEVISIACLACALISFAVARGRHPSWVVFLAVALLVWTGSR